MNILSRNLVLVSIAAFAFGCSSTQKSRSIGSSSDSTIPATIDIAAAENASHVTEITFKKNSSELTNEARRALTSIAEAATMSKKIDDVKILAWSDSEYPSEDQKRLSLHDRNLADARAYAIKKYLSSGFRVRGADTINMAQRPNALQRLFKTEDARMKRAMEIAGLTDTDSFVKQGSAKASHAVVMLITE